MEYLVVLVRNPHYIIILSKSIIYHQNIQGSGDREEKQNQGKTHEKINLAIRLLYL